MSSSITPLSIGCSFAAPTYNEENMRNKKYEDIKALYLKGHTITDIAKTCSVTRQTIYRLKKRDFEEGADWDVLALNKSRDISNIKESEERFILTLIQSFENQLEELKKLPPDEQLPLLKSYTDTYYKLKAPLQSDTKALSLEAATKALSAVVDLAQKSKNPSVQNFLSENADEILSRVLKR